MAGGRVALALPTDAGQGRNILKAGRLHAAETLG
jgi:hypothetical protein